MQLDFRQFVLKLEAISDVKPLPHQDLVVTYVKAYYIPETELEDWVKQHTVKIFSLVFTFVKLMKESILVLFIFVVHLLVIYAIKSYIWQKDC